MPDELDIDALAAEAAANNARLEELFSAASPLGSVPLERMRLARREGRSGFPPTALLDHARELEIDGPAGKLPLRVIAPDRPAAGAFLHLHGGGWALGERDMQDARLKQLADATGLAVVSVGFRLAPEHPFPAAVEDCEAAALWLCREGRAALGSDDSNVAGDLTAADDAAASGESPRSTLPLAIGGESAGAHLAALTLLRLRDRHDLATAFGAAVLDYGNFDLSFTPSARLWGERPLMLSVPAMEWFLDLFLPGRDAEQLRSPEVSPLYADLTGMPPAIFTVGTQDPLIDDTLFMEARWRASGQQTELRIWPNACHGFTAMPLGIAAAALQAEYEFLRSAMRR